MTSTNCGKIVKRRLGGWPPKARLLCDPFHINHWPTIDALYGMTIHVLLFLCANMFCMRTPSSDVRNLLRPIENCTEHLLIKCFVRLEHRIFSHICVFFSRYFLKKRTPKNVQAYCQSKLENWRIGMHPWNCLCLSVWYRWSVLHLVATIILLTLFKIFCQIFCRLKHFALDISPPPLSASPPFPFLSKKFLLICKKINILLPNRPSQQTFMKPIVIFFLT